MNLTEPVLFQKLAPVPDMAVAVEKDRHSIKIHSTSPVSSVSFYIKVIRSKGSIFSDGVIVLIKY